MSFLPPIDATYLTGKSYGVEEAVDGSQKAIILRGYPLPTDRYDSEFVDILILIPSGFPDIGCDMFYTYPWIKLSATGQYPKAADQPLEFGGITWQRWSRHSQQWRSGKDGIRTVVKRVQHAIQIAQS